jgi:hypothetical protein
VAMRVKRGKDRFWKVLKYQGDAAYYANCKCGYEYCCGNSVNRHNYKDWTIYMYCPSIIFEKVCIPIGYLVFPIFATFNCHKVNTIF